jgi:hypothetical protein
VVPAREKRKESVKCFSPESMRAPGFALAATALATMAVGVDPAQLAAATAPPPGAIQAAAHFAAPIEYPLPRASLPDGFGAKVAFQTVTRNDKATGDKVVSERLVRCGIETDANGKELFPCNPSFDTRPFIKGLDHVGTGYNSLTGLRTAPLFEWSVPPWFKPSYDSGAYNYPNKIPEQVVLTSVASGEGGMVTELFESYDQFESKQAFSMGVTFGAFGADNALSLSSKAERFRSSFQNFQIGVSKQQYKLYELEVKPEIFGYCPFVEPIFTAEKMDLEDKSAARPPPSDGVVADWTAADVGVWLKKVALDQFAEEFVKRGVTGPLLLTLEDTELTELGIQSAYDKHKLRFELQLARQEPSDKDKANNAAEDAYPGGAAPAGTAADEAPSTTPAPAEALLLLLDEKAHPLRPKNTPGRHSRFVRKWILRQAFMDAVNALPILQASEISKVCADYDEEDDDTSGDSDDEDEEDHGPSEDLPSDDDMDDDAFFFLETSATSSRRLRRGSTSKAHRLHASSRRARRSKRTGKPELIADLGNAERAYRRFLHDWGTHWTRSAVMGGEVEVTTMVRKTKSNEKSLESSQTESRVENALDTQEAESDAESGTESVVETNTGGGGGGASGARGGDGDSSSSSSSSSSSTSSSDDGESLASTNVAATSNTGPSKHSIVKGTRKEKGFLSGTADMLKDLAAAAASGMTGGVTEMIKAAIQNLQLKLAVSTSSSNSAMRTLTRENNKNEVKFVGGDTAIDPNAGTAGGMSFESWKDSIKSDPAPITKTLSPITELMVQFAGPNAGEQCEKNPSRGFRRRQMTECMTRKVLREGRALADTLYEIDQVELKKAKMETKIVENVKAAGSVSDRELTQQWASLCKIRMTLLAKRDYQKLSLYQFTFTTPNDSGQAGAHNYGKVCDRELSAMTQGGMSKIVTSVTKKDPQTGRVLQDTCAMCMAVYDNAKCLTTQNECGENSENIKFVKSKAHIQTVLSDMQCRLNPAYQRIDGKVTGAMPEEVNTWLDSATLKLDKSEWKGRNGWMGWSAILFAKTRLLCHKVTNKLVCDQFVENLRREFCLPEASNTITNRQRNRLIAALDFGVKGVSADETTARDACECASFCTPAVEIPKKGFAAFMNDLWKRQNLVKIILDKTVNQEYLTEIYRESLVQQDLMQCVAGRPLPRPILPSKQGAAWGKKIWRTITPDDTMSCKAGIDVETQVTGIFVNRVSYMGHCVDKKMCFESDYMNQGEPGRTLLETKPESDPDTPTLSVFDLSGDATRDDSNDFQDKQRKKSRKSENSKDVLEFKSWGSSPATRKYWTHRGMVYAELLKSPSTGMPKIIVVSSGIPKEPNAAVQMSQWLKKHLEMTGHNDVDPRRVLEIEDRDGNDMCMFMYSLCCAMGGVLKQDKKAVDFPHLSEQCPAGTVCCPQTTSSAEPKGPGMPVPWGPNTVRLLQVLSHGKMKGAPPMDAHNDAQGWLSHDHISPTGPSVCVGAQAFKDVFPDKTVQAKSRTVEREKMEDAKNPNVICRFECLMKGKGEGMLARSKAAPCTDKSGRKIDVRVGPVPRGECVVSGLMSLTMKVSDMETRAMEECKAFAKAQEKSADGVHSTCGYKVKLIKEIVDKEENWTENMNDSSYRSANSKTEKKKSALRRKDTPE